VLYQLSYNREREAEYSAHFLPVNQTYSFLLSLLHTPYFQLPPRVLQ
jgi:hypothetical protein